EDAQLAARYKAWRSVVRVQRWWRTIKGRHGQGNAKTINNFHAKSWLQDLQMIHEEAVVLPVFQFLHPSRCHECQKVPHHAAR
ncbi:hypothetical protein SK128_001655, partial [Halocaridina rubra]